MPTTPPIPQRFREFRHPGYTNVFSFLPTCSRLYGTETLFGDWDAPVLLLGKDGAPTPVIRNLAAREGDGAWRHAQRERGDVGGYRTNDRLVRLANGLPKARLYGSATANMLYDDPAWSRGLPGFYAGPLRDYLAEVLVWVIGKMQRLEVIACLGKDAWHLTAVVLERPDQAQRSEVYRDGEQLMDGAVAGRPIAASAHYHPAARVSDAMMSKGWASLAARLTGRDGR